MKINVFRMLAIMLLSMVGLNASAHDIEVANADGVTIYYNYSDDGKELYVTFRGGNVSSYYDEYYGIVVIPDEVTYMGRTRKVTSIREDAFASCKGLTSVTIPNSVTSIGDYAFAYCSALTSVTIGNGVTSIGLLAFCDCSRLTSVTIPNSVTSIGNSAFASCSGLTSVSIGNSVTSIGESAFAYCSSLTSLTIGNSVTSIGSSAFIYCSGLTSVTIPNSVKSIGNSVFWNCSGLTSVTIGNSVTSIGMDAFDGVDLTSVVSLIENPFAITGRGTDGSTFTQNTFYNATLYVPKGTIEKYQSTAGWKDFVFIEEGTGEEPKKCATPTISVINGEFKFSCDTEGVEYQWEITQKGNSSSGSLTGVYKVSVYAMKAGYEDSDVATAEFTMSGGGLKGDTNGDGKVDVEDVVETVNIILGEE